MIMEADTDVLCVWGGAIMGGKVVMALALNKEMNGPLRTLISADMAPGRGKISPE